ncbi:MAG: MSCRAMM family adhesin SdrC [Patescibacteria group bacterium]|nr:MSCRAMM family adhesin SdrC [Patescibacteria group bacterium]
MISAQNNKNFRKIFFALLSVFIFAFYLFINPTPSQAQQIIACTDPGQTCSITDAAWNGATCISSGVPTQCNYIWGTKTAQGTCSQNGSPIGICERTQSCCVPGQNGCPCSVTCTGSTTAPTPSCLAASGWVIAPCSGGAQCTGDSGQVCRPSTVDIPAKYCQQATYYYCYDSPANTCNTMINGCTPGADPRCFSTLPDCQNSTICKPTPVPPGAFSCTTTLDSYSSSTANARANPSGDLTGLSNIAWRLDNTEVAWTPTSDTTNTYSGLDTTQIHDFQAVYYGSRGTIPCAPVRNTVNTYPPCTPQIDLPGTASCNLAGQVTATSNPPTNYNDRVFFDVSSCLLNGGGRKDSADKGSYMWNGRGCGTVTTDPTLARPGLWSPGATTPTTWSTTTKQRGKYYIQLFVYATNNANGYIYETRCRYGVNLGSTALEKIKISGSDTLGDLTGVWCEDPITNLGVVGYPNRPKLVQVTSPAVSTDANNNFIFTFNTYQQASGTYDITAKAVLIYPEQPTAGLMQNVCNGGSSSSTNSCTLSPTGPVTTNALGQNHAFVFNGVTGVTTFTGAPGGNYTVRIQSSNNSGSCGALRDIPVHCPAPTYSITGEVFIDRNHNGVKDLTTGPLNSSVDTYYDYRPGRIIPSTGEQRQPYTLTVSGKNTGNVPSGNITLYDTVGSFVITGLEPDTYTITMHIPTGTLPSTDPNNDLGMPLYEATTGGCVSRADCRNAASRSVPITNANQTGINFGMTPMHRVKGIVFNDVNMDGNQDTGDLAIGQTNKYTSISLSGNGPTVYTSIYRGSGKYTIDNVYSNVPPYVASPLYSYYTETITPDAAPASPNLPQFVTSTNPFYYGFVQSYDPLVITRDFGLANDSFSIAGNVFTDTNGDGVKNGAEVNYPLSVNVCLYNMPSGTLVSCAATAAYSFAAVKNGSYRVTISPISGYASTFPTGRYFDVKVGQNCSFNPVPSGSPPVCSGGTNGSITNLNFGLKLYDAWFQGQGGDMRLDTGFTDQNPSTPYASIPRTQGGTAGIVFSGSSNPGFGNGGPSVPGWQAGNLNYTEEFLPTSGIKTSYNYVTNALSQAGITPTSLGCTTCAITSTLANGIYSAGPATNLTISSATFAAAKNYVILVDGNLTINGNITVPIGSTATFIVNGQITVASGVTGIDGIFSADKDFVIQGVASCPTTADVALNVEGTIIANAEGLSYNVNDNARSLCGGNTTTPVYTLTERPDFLLNLPQLIRVENRVWQEMVP